MNYNFLGRIQGKLHIATETYKGRSVWLWNSCAFIRFLKTGKIQGFRVDIS
jgi:hypothetical protein